MKSESQLKSTVVFFLSGVNLYQLWSCNAPDSFVDFVAVYMFTYLFTILLISLRMGSFHFQAEGCKRQT